MVERVARALCGCAGREADDLDGGPHPGGLWLDPGEAWWTGYEEMARAAIAAMREPTEAMMHAPSVGTSDIEVWQQMIDEALGGEK
jgi:hypothetical protein